MVVENVEYMGFGWMDRVKSYMIQRVKYVPELLQLAKNNRMLNNVNTQYMAMQASGYSAADIVSGSGDFVKWDKQTYAMSREIAENLNVPQLFILNYFLAIYNLSAAGKIPLQKWNPKEYAKKKKLQKTIDTEKSLWSKGTNVFGKISSRMLLPLMVVGGLIGYTMINDKRKDL